MADLNNIRRNTNDFSFTETVASLANNKDYKSGYQDLIEGKTNDKTYFWTALSAVGEEIGEALYENVLNYVNNAANINTCRLKPLTSIARVLGVTEFSILKNLNAIPLDVKNLMDIFSINRAYLLNTNNFNFEFVKDLLTETLDTDDIEAVSASLGAGLSALAEEGYFLSGDQASNISAINVFGSISEEKYRRFVEECFFQLLLKKVFQSYPDSPGDLVFENLVSLYGNNLSGIQNYSLESLKQMSISSKKREKKNRNAINVDGLSEDIRSSGNLYSKNGGIKIDYSTAIQNYKLAYNIDSSFNQYKIVDDIENGLDYLDNYSGGALSILMLEISERESRKFSNEGYSSKAVTRYSYYNEKEVIDYFRFINDTVLLYDLSSYSAKDLSEIKASYLTWNIYTASNYFFPYDLDNNYSVISLSNNMTLQNSINDSKKAYDSYLLSTEEKSSTFVEFVEDFYGKPYDFDENEDLSAIALTNNALRTTAMILRDICFAIVDIREKLKTQSQRNYMTGTKLLIEYILDEYVASYLKNSVGLKEEDVSPNKLKVKIQEYDDPTEYYNNNQYYSGLDGNPQTTTVVGIGFNPDDVRKYYLSTLNIGSIDSSWDTARLADFMSAVFDVGHSKTRMYSTNEDDSLKINIDDFGLTDELTLSVDVRKISSECNFTQEDYELFKERYIVSSDDGYLSIDYGFLENYWDSVSSYIANISDDVDTYNARLSSRYEDQLAIALTYGGRKFSYFPWYNYKNIDYASFQTHPYVYNFIEHNGDEYPIENAFYGNANENLIEELQTPNISVYLEEYGNIKRIWRNSIFDFSGYRSRYENYTHEYKSHNSNLLYSVQHYDGTFYPPAIELYKKYWKNEIEDPNLPDIHGLDLLSAHMTLCVDNNCYPTQSNEDVPTISSMWYYYSQVPYLKHRTKERQHIVDQLIGLSAHILSVASAEYREENRLGKNPHDVYKYGLDYLDNSFILLKRYGEETNRDASYETKRNAKGELWIRLNAHPIGFPAFADKANELSLAQFVIDRYQIDPEDLANHFEKVDLNNAIWNRYANRTIKEPEIYDFDMDEGGKHLLFAVQDDSANDVGYKKAITYSSKLNFYDLKNYFEESKERTYFLLERDEAERLTTPAEYDFMGYYQSGTRTVLLGYIKKNTEEDSLNSIVLNAKEYPGDNLFISDKGAFISFLSRDLNLLNVLPKADAKCCLGYIPQIFGAKGSFSLVTTCKIDESKPIEIQDFVGYNSISSSIEKEIRGKTDLIEATSGDFDTTGEYNSFDRFTDYVVMHNIDLKSLRNGDSSVDRPRIYALNSDASYVPQYYGLSGQNLFYRMVSKKSDEIRRSYNFDWHNDNIPIQSLELLGYTFQALNDKIKAKEDTLHLDEYTGKITDYSENDLIKNTLRVYEDYTIGNFVYQCYNESQNYDTSMSSEVSSFSISLPLDIEGLNSDEDLSNFNVLLLNTNDGGTRNPIIAGRLSYETISSSIYNEESTEEESYILSIGYMPDKQLRVVGTPNPFDPYNSTFAMDYSNHIFNICGFESKLVKSNDNKYSIELKLIISCKLIDFVLQSGILHLFVYRNTLDEFDKYHYMEPFKLFPRNAALSCWAVPWKDKVGEHLYIGDSIEELDTWKGAEAAGKFQDRRSIETRSLSAELCSITVNSEHVVGHISNKVYELSDAATIENLLQKYYLMDSIKLSSLTSFNDIYELSTGQITWKISEEDKFDYYRSLYPPSMIDNILYKLYGDTNKSSTSFSIFDLSNTYIFQLEDPVRIAERIGKIAVPIGSVADQFDYVYEDYLKDQINIDVGGKNVLNYYEIIHDPSENRTGPTTRPLPDADTVSRNSNLSSIDEEIDQVDTLEEALSVLERNQYYAEDSEQNDNTNVLDYQILSVAPEEISEYLKLYVNWRKYDNELYPEQQEIELFFNLPNLFMTPYSYRNKDGRYVPEYKPSTYMRLKSGEDSYLYIILQFKYYDMTGKLCGVRDLPILTYHIFNVSDDKPKFVITKTYEIDNHDGKNLYPDDNGNSKVYIIVEPRTYNVNNSEIDKCVGWNYSTTYDFPASTKMRVISPIPLKNLNVELAYERGKMVNSTTEDDPEFVFESTLSKPGAFSAEGSYISASFEGATNEIDLEFTLLEGAMIDEASQTRMFPIEILNADGEDINGNVPEFVLFNGYIEFDDRRPDIATGAYLARELNYAPHENFMGGSTELSASQNSRYFAGWINEEVQRALIRMYNVGRAGNVHPIVTENNNVPPNQVIKTTGARESRFDSYNDKAILFEKDPHA